MKNSFICLLLFLLLLTSCTPSQEKIQLTVDSSIVSGIESTVEKFTPLPSLTPNPTYTSYPTYTPQSTFTPIIIVVTATSTPTPEYTPTITLTPTQTATFTMTPNPKMADFTDGFYLVNIDIAPGIWRSSGTGDDCYWEVTTSTGEIIDNHFGMAGGTMYVPSNAFQVMVEDCGTWTYIGQ